MTSTARRSSCWRTLLNALKVVGKRAEDVTVVIVGAGAAGLACADILLAQGSGT
jgi:malate dehydrogenase (oxaloacetate-decarboxylating)